MRGEYGPAESNESSEVRKDQRCAVGGHRTLKREVCTKNCDAEQQHLIRHLVFRFFWVVAIRYEIWG